MEIKSPDEIEEKKETIGIKETTDIEEVIGIKETTDIEEVIGIKETTGINDTLEDKIEDKNVIEIVTISKLTSGNNNLLF